MAGPYGSVGTDYRELQGPEQVNTDLPDNGAAARAQALGSLFKEFEGVSSDIGTKVQTQAGSIAGAAAGATGTPGYKQGLKRLTAYGQAYNNAATGAYAIEAEAQADDAAARLRVQANNNPATFQATYSAVRDGVLKNAPPMAREMLTELYNKHLAAGLAAISGDQAAEQRELQRKNYDEGVGRQITRVARLQGSDNPQDQLAADDEHVKLSLMIDGGKNAGLYSDAEAQAMRVNSMREITAEVFQTQADKELQNPNGDIVQFLERFRQAHLTNLSDPNSAPILSEPEYQKLFADAITKAREENLLIAATKRDGKTAEQVRWDAGDVQYTSQLLQGSLTERNLDVAVRNGDLKPETARALRSQMNNGDQIKSDPRALYQVHNDPNFLDMTVKDVAGLSDINYTDKLKIIDEIDKRNSSWEGTQAVKQAKGSISAALKIPAGTPAASLSDDQRKALTDANQEFIQLQNDTDPAKRDGMASSNAQIAIKHANQRSAAADAVGYQSARDAYIKRFGPSGSEPANDKDFQSRLQHYADLIKQSQAAAKGN